MLPDTGTVDTAALTGRHFDKDILQAALLQLPEGGHAILHSIDGDIVEVLGVVHGFQDPAGGGEEPGPFPFLGLPGRPLKGDILSGHPLPQLVKGENDIGIDVYKRQAQNYLGVNRFYHIYLILPGLMADWYVLDVTSNQTQRVKAPSHADLPYFRRTR